jgi:hypothetical protein
MTSISSFLVQNEHTIPLIAAINALPEWWNTVSRSHKFLQRVPGHALLQRLRQWLVEGIQVEVQEPVPNTFLAPLTVGMHVVEYLSYLESKSVSHASVLRATGACGFQGLCIGQLTAIACSSATNDSELHEQAAVALRLAVLIGAIIDLDGCYAEPPKQWACVIARHKSSDLSQPITDVLAGYPEVSRCTPIISEQTQLTSTRRSYRLSRALQQALSPFHNVTSVKSLPNWRLEA